MPWRRKNISIPLFWKNTILEVFFIISSTFNNLFCHSAICIWQFNVDLYHFMTRFSSTFDGLLWHLWPLTLELRRNAVVYGGCKPLKSHQHNQLTTLKLENPEGNGDDDGGNYNNNDKKLQQWQIRQQKLKKTVEKNLVNVNYQTLKTMTMLVAMMMTMVMMH